MRRVAVTPVRVSGAALLAIAAAMVLSAAVAVIDGGGAAIGLLVASLITALAGAALFYGSKVSPTADSALAFASVAWSWVAVSVAAELEGKE